MKLANAIKKLERAGFSKHSSSVNYVEFVLGKELVILCTYGSENVQSIKCQTVGEVDHPESDSFAGFWMDNVTKAINFSKSFHERAIKNNSKQENAF